MAYGVRLRIWGEYACFTRPELKVERVSYDVVTPSAARGIMEAIYWKPSVCWAIDRLYVVNPIRYDNIRRNEVATRVPVGNVRKAMRGDTGRIGMFVEEQRQQRSALLLRDVVYVIEAHFSVVGSFDTSPAKHKEMFERRASRGQCFHQPYLGCREFPAHFDLVDTIPCSANKGVKDLGWMLHDVDFDRGREPVFFRAVMKDGVIDVPPLQRRAVNP